MTGEAKRKDKDMSKHKIVGLVIENIRNEDTDKAVTMTDVTLRD